MNKFKYKFKIKMGACQTQQNIDINLFINNGEVQTKKKISLENKKNPQKNINQIIKKAYINNIQFNNTKKNYNNSYKFSLVNQKNKIPTTRNKLKKEMNFTTHNEKNGKYFNTITNRLNLSYTGDKIPIDNIRSNSRDGKKLLNMSYNDRLITDNSNNISKEKNYLLTDRNTNSNKNTSAISKNYNNSKIIKDEDDTENIISHLNEQIKRKKTNKKSNLILSFDDFENNNENKEDLKLYYLNEFNFNSYYKYSKEKDFDNILQSQAYKNQVNFTNLIL